MTCFEAASTFSRAGEAGPACPFIESVPEVDTETNREWVGLGDRGGLRIHRNDLVVQDEVEGVFLVQLGHLVMRLNHFVAIRVANCLTRGAKSRLSPVRWSQGLYPAATPRKPDGASVRRGSTPGTGPGRRGPAGAIRPSCVQRRSGRSSRRCPRPRGWSRKGTAPAAEAGSRRRSPIWRLLNPSGVYLGRIPELP